MIAARRALHFLSRHWASLILASAGVGISLLIIRSAAVALAVAPNPAVALRFNESSGVALDSYAAQLAASHDLANQARAAAIAKRALRESPLLAHPFLLIAEQRERAGDPVGAIAAMNIAIRRDPRSISARQWLLQHQLEIGDYRGAIAEVDAITRLRPDLRSQYGAALVSLLSVPEARLPLADALVDNPAWQWQFLNAAVREPGDHAPIYALLRALVRNQGTQISGDSLSLILSNMIHNGDILIARSIFDEFTRSTDGGENLIFDGSFRRLQGPQPFNWALPSSSIGDASFDIDSVGGATLLARRFGGGSALLAGQVLTLPPGRYELTTRVRADDTPLDDSFSWRITCLRDDRLLVRIDNPPNGQGSIDLKSGFLVGRDCPGQHLGLWTEPTNGNASGAARYGFIAVRRVGNLESAE